MTDTGPSLEPDRATQEDWLARFSRLALDQVEALARAPAHGLVGPAGIEAGARASVPIPEAPLSGGPERICEILAAALPASLNTPGPGYLAYVPGGGLYAAALADFVADSFNRFTGLSAAAPGPCRLEADVLGWLARELGYGEAARGLLTPGGSLANLSAIVAARHEAFGDGGDLSRALVYTSTQAHHSVAKAARVAGIPPANVRRVDVDELWRMDVAALERTIAADRVAGGRPFLVVAAAGTTNTGAVDPLPALADLCARERLWLHADGAYGGAFALCPEGKAILAGLERCDSITFDPHKGMFLPYGTGCLLVSDGERLRRAHHLPADYLQDFDAVDRTGEPPSPTEYGPELSRDFRGLRLWLALMLHGAAAFRAALGEKLALARRFHQRLGVAIDAGAPLEIVAAPQLSTVAFRTRTRPGESTDEHNRRDGALLAAINRRGRVYLSSTMLPAHGGAAFTLRVCVLSFRTHVAQVDACLQDLLDAVAEAERALV